MMIHQAVSADSFIDTIGINTHLHYTDTVYKDFVGTIKPSLIDLGVRHLRDGAKTYDGINEDTFFYKRVRALAAEGMQFTFITTSLDTPWTTTTNYGLLDEVYEWSDGAIAAFEGVNEPDIQGVESWIPATLLGQQDLYDAVQADPDLQGLPIVGPSIVNFQNLDDVGDLSDLIDFGNIHNYYAGRHPETTGWGDDGYGSLAWHMAQVFTLSGDDPIMATETGWHNTVDGDGNYVGVPQDVEAKYIPRLFLTHFNAGIARTFLYELIDLQDRPTHRESNFGLLNHDGTPQPGYDALQNLVEILEDPGPQFDPVPLGFALQGDTDDVHQTLLQKRDGSYFLALWLGKASWDPNAKSPIDVPSQTVTIELPDGFNQATLHQFGADGQVQVTDETVVEDKLTLSVGDTVTLVELSAPDAYRPVVESPSIEASLTQSQSDPPSRIDASLHAAMSSAMTATAPEADPLLVTIPGFDAFSSNPETVGLFQAHLSTMPKFEGMPLDFVVRGSAEPFSYVDDAGLFLNSLSTDIYVPGDIGTSSA